MNSIFTFVFSSLFRGIPVRVTFDPRSWFVAKWQTEIFEKPNFPSLNFYILGYLNETGEIVNLDLANERRSEIFTEEFYNSFDGRLNRFVKLYDFIMENHE